MRKVSIFLLTALSTAIFGQPIETDRPDQTETSAIVPVNYFQAENGFLYEKVDQNKENFVHPNILWKLGINENFELRLITEFSTEKIINERYSGISPVAVGFKTKLQNERGFIPEISFMGHLTVGNLGSKLQQSGLAPDFRFLFSHILSEKLSLGYNLGAFWELNDPTANGIYTISTAYSFQKNLEDLLRFLEL